MNLSPEAVVLQTSPSRLDPPTISHRDLHLLRAVADRRVECSGSDHPDFFVDGIPCCDHVAARELTRTGLIQAATTGTDGDRLPVQLTAAGEAVLDRSSDRR